MSIQRPTWLSDPEHCLRIGVPAGEFDAYIAYAERTAPVVIVLHEIFGINADMRATCDELASAGFTAMCPDLFWRQERNIDFSSWSQTEWNRGLALYRAFDLDEGVRDVAAAVAAGRVLHHANGSVGVMGFCLGGLLTFLTACRARLDAAVAWHGGRTEEFLAEAASLSSPMLMHLAEEDEFIPAEAQRQIRETLQPLPKVEIHTYPGCHHAFARHAGTHYDAKAAALANGRTRAFLRRYLW
ncbi:MAG: dienelactone hydrolase family protein [Gammaproteobacteria bacterium]